MCSQECINNYCTDKELKIRDSEDYSNLIQYIMSVHDITFIPNIFYIRLRDLRNGITRNGNSVIATTKGVSWVDLIIAYEYSESTIKRVKLTKDFDNISNELMYCLSIVKNNFYKAKQSNRQQELNNKIAINVPHCESEDYKYKKLIPNDDISDLF